VNGVAYTAMPLLTGTNVNGPYAGTLRPVAGGAAGNASNSFPDGTSARRAQLALKVIF
jgi:hypothetical protein